MLRRMIFTPLLILAIGVYLRPAAGQAVANDGYGDYLLVPAGSFLMGDHTGQGDPDEAPVHTVYLDEYYIGKDKITNQEYARFILDKGYEQAEYWTNGGFGQYGDRPRHWMRERFHGGGLPGNENFPVVGVSWFEAAAYCRWLSDKTGQTYRLPTEAEWEKAARGTDQRQFAWGDSIDGSYANYDNSGGPYEPGLTPVGFYDGSVRDDFATHDNCSPYGARDMIGNVWEWCQDWYGGSEMYQNSPKKNPQGPKTGSSRVLRAGGWVDSAYYQRAANRNSSFPENRNPIQGFRCVRER